MDVKKTVRKIRKVKRKISKVKREEILDFTGGFITKEYCPEKCGCKLATNFKYIWCSFVNCNYWRKYEK